MNYTANYQLPQWVDSDRILRTDFNSAYQKLDAALKTNADGLAANTAAIANKGNCQLYTASYVGNGAYGSGSPNNLTFPAQPLAVFVAECGSNGLAFWALQGMVTCHASGNSVGLTLSWGGASCSWFCSSGPIGQLNAAGVTYQVAALFQQGA